MGFFFADLKWCETDQHKPRLGNLPQEPWETRAGEGTRGGPCHLRTTTRPGEKWQGELPRKQAARFPGTQSLSAAAHSARVPGRGRCEGSAPRKQGARAARRPGPASQSPPARPPARLTAGVSGSQPRVGAAERRRRRRRDPGPSRRVIIPPARAGPGPGPRPPAPSPRPSCGGSLASLPPAPPPGPSPPPPPPPPRTLAPRPPAVVRGHSRAPHSAAAVAARPDERSPERPPPSGQPRLPGTLHPPRAMTPSEAEVRRGGRAGAAAKYRGPREWGRLCGEPVWTECGGRDPRPLRTAEMC